MASLNDEQIITLLEYLFTNMNNLDRLYYDMFINTTPMDLTLERYNEDGIKETHTLPNRAKDKQKVLQGKGTPEGSVESSIGVMYFDTQNNDIYIKMTSSGTYGWTRIMTHATFIPGEDYLRPDGSAALLTDLSTTSFDIGLLRTDVGGTGTTGLTGIIKGQGVGEPYTTAKPHIDYLTPDDFIGTVALFPIDAGKLPSGWFKCDGSQLAQADYPRLFAKIGTKYNKGTVPTTHFMLPNYNTYYLRCSTNNTVSTAEIQPAVPNLKGHFQGSTSKNNTNYIDGVLFKNNGTGGLTHVYGQKSDVYDFDASRYSSIYKDGINEVTVKSKYIMPCIYAGPVVLED